jgi:membrane associated rhomboid family serine protease
MVWGPKRFLTYYLICGIGAGLIIGIATLVQTYPAIADINLLMHEPTVENFNMLYNKYSLETIFREAPQVYTTINANAGNPEIKQMIYENALGLKDYFTSGTVVGASGALYGLIIAAGYLFPDDLVYYGFFIPIKMKWLAIGYTAIELYAAIQNNPGDPVAHVAHLGGAAIGFLILFFSYRRGGRNKLF